MREHGILFTIPNVQAILAGRKDVTRRIVDKEAESDILKRRRAYDVHDESSLVRVNGKLFDAKDPVHAKILALWSPYGVPGDQLWVRETWLDLTPAILGGHYEGPRSFVAYRADRQIIERHDNDHVMTAVDTASLPVTIDWEKLRGWKPPRYMPHWAARLLLEVVSVRVERLQEITIAEALREGCGPVEHPKNVNPSPLDVFHELWDEINGETAPWDCNPLVWRIEFRRLP